MDFTDSIWDNEYLPTYFYKFLCKTDLSPTTVTHNSRNKNPHYIPDVLKNSQTAVKEHKQKPQTAEEKQ